MSFFGFVCLFGNSYWETQICIFPSTNFKKRTNLKKIHTNPKKDTNLVRFCKVQFTALAY